MYVNDRDQINYHGFLTALRTMRGYLLKQVSTGICCESGMNRFEKGNRVAEKLVRDRLTARLGVSCEKYEDYLQPKEYVRWEQRLRIVKAIEKRDLKTAKHELSEYEGHPNLNRINQQFVETMRFMMLSLEDVSKDELRDCIEKAVELTVPNIKKALDGEHLLSDQEVNLILEQMYLEVPKKVIKEEKAWRISEYEKLISYMEDSCWEQLQKAKIYPKVTYYICKQLLSKETTETEIRRGLALCHNAIELLRDTSRLYYFIELTEARRALATRLMESDIGAAEKSKLEEMLLENNQWENVFKDLYTEYQVAPYMSDFCYLYYENECHDMVEVIETRRKMLGLSRVKLGEGICTEKTIVRFEREGFNPTIELVRRLFDKMGLCAEYRRARVITTDVNALMLSNEVIGYMNNLCFAEGEKYFRQLENSLVRVIPQNKQEMIRLSAIIDYNRNNIDGKEFYIKSKEALECTLPVDVLYKGRIGYFTRSELTQIHDLAFGTKGELRDVCIEVMEEICSSTQEDINAVNICLYEFIMASMASYLGNIGRYEESNDISDKMMKECLAFRRNNNISDYLYNYIWNFENNTPHIDDEIIRKGLYTCKILCEVVRKDNWKAFFHDKLETMDN